MKKLFIIFTILFFTLSSFAQIGRFDKIYVKSPKVGLGTEKMMVWDSAKGEVRVSDSVPGGSTSLTYDGSQVVKRQFWPYNLTPGTRTIQELLDWFFYPSIDATYFFGNPAAIYGYAYFEVGSTNTVTISFSITKNDDVPVSGHADMTYPISTPNIHTWGTQLSTSFTVSYNPVALGYVTYQGYETVLRGGNSVEDGPSKIASLQLRSCYPYLYGTDPIDFSSDWTNFYSAMTVDPKAECADCYTPYVMNHGLEYMYFAYPQSYGPLQQILNHLGYDETESFTKHSVLLSSSKWTNIPYYVYQSENPFVINQAVWIYRFKQ